MEREEVGPQRSCEVRAGSWEDTFLKTRGQNEKIDDLGWKEVHRMLQRLAHQNESEKLHLPDSFP